jgi:Raf kinase inhibitor-like YbhB/YbcL family protein
MTLETTSRRSLITVAGAAGLTIVGPRIAAAQATPEPEATPIATILYDPYARLPQVPSFDLTSTDVQSGQLMSSAQMGSRVGGEDKSPQLSWSGFPAETKSFVVTMFDPDAPSPSGFWHWAVADIPASSTDLPNDAGNQDNKLLPPGAFMLPNDTRMPKYIGAAPPKPQTHRYFIAVHALSVDKIGIDPQSTVSLLCATLSGRLLARALLVPLAKA